MSILLGLVSTEVQLWGLMWWHELLKPGHLPWAFKFSHSVIYMIPGYAGLLALSALSGSLSKAFRNFWGHWRTRIGHEQPGDVPRIYLCGHDISPPPHHGSHAMLDIV